MEFWHAKRRYSSRLKVNGNQPFWIMVWNYPPTQDAIVTTRLLNLHLWRLHPGWGGRPKRWWFSMAMKAGSVGSFDGSERNPLRLPPNLLMAGEGPVFICSKEFTLRETNIAPENRPFQKETSIQNIHFQVRTVSFREGNLWWHLMQNFFHQQYHCNSGLSIAFHRVCV